MHMVNRPFWKNRINQAWKHRSIIWLSGVRRVGKTKLCQSLPHSCRKYTFDILILIFGLEGFTISFFKSRFNFALQNFLYFLIIFSIKLITLIFKDDDMGIVLKIIIADILYW